MVKRLVKFGKRSKRLVSVENNTVGNFESATTSNLNLVTIHDVELEPAFSEEFDLMANSEDAPKLHDSANAPDDSLVYVYLDGSFLKPCI